MSRALSHDSRGFTAMLQPCFPSGEDNTFSISSSSRLKKSGLNAPLVYPVFKVGEVSASPSSSEASSEARRGRGAAGATKGASAGGAASPTPWCHVAPPTAVTPSSSIVSKRDAEGLRVHASLLRPGGPAVPGDTGRR